MDEFAGRIALGHEEYTAYDCPDSRGAGSIVGGMKERDSAASSEM